MGRIINWINSILFVLGLIVIMVGIPYFIYSLTGGISDGDPEKVVIVRTVGAFTNSSESTIEISLNLRSDYNIWILQNVTIQKAPLGIDPQSFVCAEGCGVSLSAGDFTHQVIMKTTGSLLSGMYHFLLIYEGESTLKNTQFSLLITI